MNKKFLFFGTFLGAIVFTPVLHAQQSLTGLLTTPAAKTDQANLCASTGVYPSAALWFAKAGPQHPSMLAATSGTPKIEQYRAGALIATYTHFTNQPGCTLKQDGTDWQNPGPAAASGCGPFTRTHSWRLFAPGDDFKVYSAVYGANGDMPWFGPSFTGDQPWPNDMVNPDNVTVEGVPTGNAWPVILATNGSASDNTLGMALVYFDASTGMTFKGFVIASTGPQVQGLKAAIYNVAASNVTMSQLHVTGFEAPSNTTNGANGIFGGGNYSGFWKISGVETDHNGGATGSQQHESYIAASTVDKKFTVLVDHLYSHDTVQGHLFKCRCQNLTITASYLDGGVPQTGELQADDYDLDFPNGGNLIAKDNIFVKNASGPDTNGINLAWMMEGNPDGRSVSIDIENNTFVTFAKTFDGSHSNFPISFLYPQQVPSAPTFPALSKPLVVRDNAFVGFCPTGQAPLDYRGDFAEILGFSEMTASYQITNTYTPSDGNTSAIGGATYAHVAHGGGARKTAVIGAFDPVKPIAAKTGVKHTHVVKHAKG